LKMIKVLVVDDSLFMRRLISDMLNSDPEIKVIGTAKDGSEAMEKISKLKPDCVTLDLIMPGRGGLPTLKQIMDEYPTPCVILSAHSKEGADVTMECLEAGAVGFVLKPSGELSLDIRVIKEQLLKEVKAASGVNLEKIKPLIKKKPKRPRRRLIALNKIVVIGASTGGMQTLERILPSLPADFPVPLIIIQHVPSRFFTESLAEHLNKVTELEVKVAEDGETLQPGTVYLAPAGFQMRLKARDREVAVTLTKDKPGALTPSVDMTMESVAKVYRGNAIGIILTGMGRDGTEGMKAIKEVGGKTVVQDESSLIFGMPKAVIDAGCAEAVLPADEMAEAMVKLVEK